MESNNKERVKEFVKKALGTDVNFEIAMPQGNPLVFLRWIREGMDVIYGLDGDGDIPDAKACAVVCNGTVYVWDRVPMMQRLINDGELLHNPYQEKLSQKYKGLLPKNCKSITLLCMGMNEYAMRRFKQLCRSVGAPKEAPDRAEIEETAAEMQLGMTIRSVEENFRCCCPKYCSEDVLKVAFGKLDVSAHVSDRVTFHYEEIAQYKALLSEARKLVKQGTAIEGWKVELADALQKTIDAGARTVTVGIRGPYGGDTVKADPEDMLRHLQRYYNGTNLSASSLGLYSTQAYYAFGRIMTEQHWNANGRGSFENIASISYRGKTLYEKPEKDTAYEDYINSLER